MPTHVGILWPMAEEALDCPRGDLELSYCPECGFVYNTAFDPARVEYGHSYDNALHFSPVFQAYERDLAEGLIDRYQLRDSDIVEIGCGSGHFLGMVCELSQSRGPGLDPSYSPDHADALISERVRIIAEYFTRAHSQIPADLVVCRHFPEHVRDPAALLRDLREGIGERAGTVLYIEVPNAMLALRRLSIGDLIYEHVSYFLESLLRTIVDRAGFEVLDLHESYDGQFLALEVRSAVGPGTPAAIRVDPKVLADIRAFPQHAARRVTRWQRDVEDLRHDGARVVAWGAGAKAVGYFNLLGSDIGVDRVVDMNPRKQGTHLAGTGQRIVAPGALVRDPPDVVLVMNPYYATEIGQTLSDLGISRTPDRLTTSQPILGPHLRRKPHTTSQPRNANRATPVEATGGCAEPW